MNSLSTDRRLSALPLLGIMGLMVCATACGQIPVDEEGNALPYELKSSDNSLVNDDIGLLTQTELVSLVGPIALYPDDLLAIVLPASTYPLEIVQAARFLENLKDDSSTTPDDAWDDSIVALLNYPEVVQLMNEDINWTLKLGEAVVAQQGAVVAAVESFRDTVYTAGNLQSDEYQSVTHDEGIIEIKSVSEKVIYVPYYEPARVVVYSPYPVYNYYPRSYPSYYYPYASDYHFGAGFFWGVTTAFRIGWASDYLHVFHHSYRGHPYHGRSYYGHKYRRRSIEVHTEHYENKHRRHSRDSHRTGDSWRPQHSGGARPGMRVARNKYDHGANRRGNKLADSTRKPRTDRSGQIRSRDSKSRERVHNSTGRREAIISRSSSENQAVTFRSRDMRGSKSSAAVQVTNRGRNGNLIGRSQRNTQVGRTKSDSSTAKNRRGAQSGRSNSNMQIASKPKDSTNRSGAERRNGQVKTTRTVTKSRKGEPSRKTTVKTSKRTSVSGESAKQRDRSVAKRHRNRDSNSRGSNSRR